MELRARSSSVGDRARRAPHRYVHAMIHEWFVGVHGSLFHNSIMITWSHPRHPMKRTRSAHHLFRMLRRGSRFGACCDAYTGALMPASFMEARNFANRWHFKVSRERSVGRFTFRFFLKLYFSWRDVVRPGRRRFVSGKQTQSRKSTESYPSSDATHSNQQIR